VPPRAGPQSAPRPSACVYRSTFPAPELPRAPPRAFLVAAADLQALASRVNFHFHFHGLPSARGHPPLPGWKSPLARVCSFSPPRVRVQAPTRPRGSTPRSVGRRQLVRSSRAARLPAVLSFALIKFRRISKGKEDTRVPDHSPPAWRLLGPARVPSPRPSHIAPHASPRVLSPRAALPPLPSLYTRKRLPPVPDHPIPLFPLFHSALLYDPAVARPAGAYTRPLLSST